MSVGGSFRDDIILVHQCKLSVSCRFRDDIILMHQCKLSVGLVGLEMI